MAELLEVIIVLLIAIGSAVYKSSKRRDAASKQEQQETEEYLCEDSQGPAEPGAPIFAYYYKADGEKRVDKARSEALSGREIDEYEIFTEQRRLDELWMAELERRDAEQRERIYGDEPEREPAPDMPDMGEVMRSAREMRREEPQNEAEPVSYEDAAVEYSQDELERQREQLDRWLEAGLIDKAEYRRRKSALK